MQIFQDLNRFKFECFCFYKHETNDVLRQNNDDEIDARFATLETRLHYFEAEIKENDFKIKKLEEKTDYLDKNLKTVIERKMS